jgi:hypothetical protein
MSAATQPPRPAHPRIAVGIIPVRAPITTAQRRPRTTRQKRAFASAPNRLFSMPHTWQCSVQHQDHLAINRLIGYPYLKILPRQSYAIF